jgi:hypothetical protein
MASSHKASWSFDRNSSPASATSAHSPTASPARSASPASSPEAHPRPAHTLSVKEYHSEDQRLYRQGVMDPRMDKESPDAARRPRLARDDLFADLEKQVSYGSDTSMTTPPRSPEPEAQELRAHNPFPELGADRELSAQRASSGLESGVITNALDEVQERQLEEGEVQRSQRPEARPLLISHREYRFRARDPAEVVKEAMGQRSLRAWICGPAATAASELEARDALRAIHRRRRQLSMELAWQIKHVVRRYQTYGRTPSCSFQERPPKRTMSCSATGLSALGSSPRWMLYELASRKFDVRLERRLLFEYAKVKTKRQAPLSSTRPPGPVPPAPPSYELPPRWEHGCHSPGSALELSG